MLAREYRIEKKEYGAAGANGALYSLFSMLYSTLLFPSG
jgi:hypothetical protein